MDEDAARRVMLVRALETSEGSPVTDDDRRHAARAAAELARWDASTRGVAATNELYVVRRAELLAQKAAAREPRVERALSAFAWRPWLGIVLPAAALLFGLLAEQIGDRQRVNLMAFPLAGVILWNLAVYVVLALRSIARATRPGNDRMPGPLRQWLAAMAERRPRFGSARAGAWLPAFAAHWARASSALAAARAARILHIAAAMVGIGLVIGLYARGLVFEYRVGWESTFLDAGTVRAALALLLAPAAWLLNVQLPSVNDVEAMRFGGAGASAAPWIHLYAASVALWVILPRLVLALAAATFEWRRRTHFNVDLDEPYFRRLSASFDERALRLRIVPYSYRPDEASVAALRELAKQLAGERADVEMRPAVAVGAEDRADDGIVGDDPDVPMTIALFSLAATPETESHGVFIDRLRQQSAAPVVALVDSAALRARFGEASERLAERRDTWLAFFAAKNIPAAVVDLQRPDLETARQQFEGVVAR